MNEKPAIVGDSTPIPSQSPPEHLPPAPLTINECGPGTVTYRGIPMAVVAPTDLIHVLPPVDPPAFPETGSTTVTAYGLQVHRLGDSRISGEKTVIVDDKLPDAWGDISRVDINIGD
jgi:hypothetical protein